MPRKKNLPRYVVLKTYYGKKHWYVRRTFPTAEFYPNGQRVYIEMVTKCEPETAERAAELSAWLVEEFNRQKAKTVSNTPDPTVSVYLNEYLEIIKPKLSRRTHEDYSEIHKRYIKNTIGKLKIAKLAPLDVQKLYSALSAKGISGGVVRKVHSLLFQALKQAVKWQKTEINAAEDAILPKLTHIDKAAMSKEELAKFIGYCKKSLKNLVFWFALETGFRPGEYLALRWSDIDLETCVVRLDRAVSFARSGGNPEFKELKTSFSRRSVKLTRELTDALCGLKKSQEAQEAELKAKILRFRNVQKQFTPHKKKISSRGGMFSNRKKREQIIENTHEHLKNIKELDLVFPGRKGKPRSMLNLNRRELKEILKACGIDPRKYSLYSLRHTCLTQMSHVLTVRELQDFAGHASITTTLKFYVHASDDAKAKAADAWSSIIS
ncbi:MAG: site-specific integrase [Pyrinomonadaceae bacterium]|nr:site-specific integrase [Pyrinomonadaceae bacterium]